MAQPDTPKDKTPHPRHEGGVKTGQPSEKKSFGDHPAAPAREGGTAEEVGADPAPKRDGGMLSEG